MCTSVSPPPVAKAAATSGLLVSMTWTAFRDLLVCGEIHVFTRELRARLWLGDTASTTTSRVFQGACVQSILSGL